MATATEKPAAATTPAPAPAPADPTPLCTTCAHPAPHVYTTYTSKSNIRLGVCTHCGAFIDPLIEAPALLLVLDLVLLKPRVFLHLLFNRGSPPLDASAGAPPGSAASSSSSAAQPPCPYLARVRHDLAALGVATLAADVGVRVLPLLQSPGSFNATLKAVILTVVAAALELLAQHAATLALALAILYARGWYPARKGGSLSSRDGRQRSFVPELVPLVLLYTTLFPLLLQLALSIWYAPPASIHETLLPTAASASVLPERVVAALPAALADSIKAAEDGVVAAWSGANRVWAGTRLLGGMSAGFGLRVLLPTRPWETTSIVIFGWVAALLAAQWLDPLLLG
ncbi:Protein arv1 [Vanrija pseudolonga]|uniref:Protein ARV n=1 Tax=Vanrija pseudolonga TaxID=143232 RepID=A0AAF0Y8W7_9TREE|nr:Protein arv1 [Vanrija pseudolonga]